MKQGIVKLFNESRGWGFVKCDDGSPDQFCHISQVRGGYMSLVPGQRVEFEIGISQKSGREHAINIRVIPPIISPRSPAFRKDDDRGEPARDIAEAAFMSNGR